jgi:iron-sulfur cluster assembly protein
MLALTETAAEVVDSIVSNESLPETAGLRITSEHSASESNSEGPVRDLRLAVVEEPESGDELVAGTQIYVEPGETADLLNDKVLDADVSGDEVQFTLLQQAGSDSG